MTDLTLGHGLTFPELYTHEGLARLDRAFVDELRGADAELGNRLLAARAEPDALDPKAESDLLLDLAPHVEDFVARTFGVERELRALAARHHELEPLYRVKRLFVQRRAAKAVGAEEAAGLDPAALRAALAVEAPLGQPAWELAYARRVDAWMQDEPAHAAELDAAARYAAWALLAPEGRALHGAGILFQVPHKTDPARLVPVETVEVEGVTMMRLPDERQHLRQGFDLTDCGTDLAGALDETNYCIWCHHQGKDSCSKGLRDRKTGAFQTSAFGVTLAGCPLEEKISEMHEVKARGQAIGALALIVVDNPMCAGTGHRICNDCMKACIYQKQEPVDIPQAETRILKDVLELPWGFEIYGLLTRWNPLNLRRPLTRPLSGYKVLVVGLGPAGYTLAHHLMNDGHTVVGVDGLKIEPLPPEVAGVAGTGERVPFRPIRDLRAELFERLDERVMAGFGGVAEYGITVRWDKNFLKVIRLLLERRERFAMFGGVRFGGTLTLDDAFAAGFDHVALCAGAGRPTIVPMKNGLARGVRQASDFLMALQLTGAAKADSIANLEVRLPIVVIGGGLTAVDTATESLAYYPVQVEKFLARYETLVVERGEEAVRRAWSEEEREVATEFLAHARALRAERAAVAEGREPRIRELLDGWGGATIAYRRRLIDSPSYTLNHEEVALAMREGIRFLECVSPRAVETDRFGHAAALHLAHLPAGPDGVVAPAAVDVTVPARTILVAAGTQPNTVLAREAPEWVELDGKYFQALDEEGRPVRPERLAKPEAVHVLMALEDDGRAVSFFGDLHPSFAGNVVKAMGGARQGFPVVGRVLRRRTPAAVAASPWWTPAATDSPLAVLAKMNAELRAVVHGVERLAPNIVEVVVRAPRAAARFEPGQFYRLQNFETRARCTADGTTLAMEGLALTGAWVDKDRGLLSTIVLEMGGSSDLCALLEPGEPVILMGPTGTPTEIPENETLCLVGGGLGNAVLFSIGQAARARGCRVLYFAGYRRTVDRYKVEQIEAAADRVVWCSDETPGFTPGRPGDKSFVGNIVQAMRAYAEGELGACDIPLGAVDRIVAIGSDRMMAAVARARHDVLAPHLKTDHLAIGSINSPMQCMMKEICGQCLQTHRDPATGEETVVFSCFNQDQPLDCVDFGNLNERLRQNAVQEKLTAQWIDRGLKELQLRRRAG